MDRFDVALVILALVYFTLCHTAAKRLSEGTFSYLFFLAVGVGMSPLVTWFLYFLSREAAKEEERERIRREVEDDIRGYRRRRRKGDDDGFPVFVPDSDGD